ncbi:hypothetical protein N3930_18030 [Bacillus thuringiensis]|nr:hypothetical protein [Bacillus thuringiensis]
MGKLLKLVILCMCLMTVIIFASKISYASKNKSESVLKNINNSSLLIVQA